VRGPIRNPVVHLELHTADSVAACELYRSLFGWRREDVRVRSASYLALDFARGVGGGIVECPTERALWLPYVKVGDIAAATAHAQRLGAEVLLDPREGQSGWRSVIGTPAGGELALWQAR
jgi:predicted enzyme related to lactoylglutathione lyase